VSSNLTFNKQFQTKKLIFLTLFSIFLGRTREKHYLFFSLRGSRVTRSVCKFLFYKRFEVFNSSCITNRQTNASTRFLRAGPPTQVQLHSTLFIYHTAQFLPQALAWTTLNPPVTNFVISSFLCWSKLSAYVTSFHCLSVSHLGNLAASLSASCLACLSCRTD
jgi:hypothetical protein